MEQRSRGVEALIRPIVFKRICSEPQSETVRTTLGIDADLLEFASSVAVARGVPTGRAVSDLMRLGMEASVSAREEGMPPRPDAPGDWSGAARA